MTRIEDMEKTKFFFFFKIKTNAVWRFGRILPSQFIEFLNWQAYARFIHWMSKPNLTNNFSVVKKNAATNLTA